MLKVLRAGQRQLFVAYRQRQNQRLDAEEYGPCPYCYGYYPKKILSRHNNNCKFANAAGSRKRLAVESGLLLPKSKQGSTILRRVIESMRNDEISRIVKSDDTILAFREKLCAQWGNDDEQHNDIRQKLKEVARLLKDTRSCSGNVEKSLENFIYPDAFKFITQSRKNVAGFDGNTNTYATPSLALKIGSTLQKCLRILISKGIETNKG
ncbi:hypothetical protein DPMN_118537 [Dreissena polymorpha]|uniref:Uncharacterized protein n=1 Tax=Dreissena polymorpha TaxID=45954 RepID=A0A9D4JLT4_DREPO|nr:hypothetical protein DPMN_118537 [Dreissena polymorpha]